MSKSSENFIPVFCSDEDTEVCVSRIVTRPVLYGRPIDTKDDTIMTLFRLVASATEAGELEQEMNQGSLGYEEAKARLTQRINDFFRSAREAKLEWESRVDEVEDILREGAAAVRFEVQSTLEQLRELTGIGSYRRFIR